MFLSRFSLGKCTRGILYPAFRQKRVIFILRRVLVRRNHIRHCFLNDFFFLLVLNTNARLRFLEQCLLIARVEPVDDVDSGYFFFLCKTRWCLARATVDIQRALRFVHRGGILEGEVLLVFWALALFFRRLLLFGISSLVRGIFEWLILSTLFERLGLTHGENAFAFLELDLVVINGILLRLLVRLLLRLIPPKKLHYAIFNPTLIGLLNRFKWRAWYNLLLFPGLTWL